MLRWDDNKPPHSREDDLESFYHVLNWMALRYTSHTLDSETLTSELQRIFDYSYRSQNGAEGGQAKRGALTSGMTNMDAAFKNQGLATLLETIRNLVAVRYRHQPTSKADQANVDCYQSRMNKLCKQGAFTSLFVEALSSDEDWVTNGARVDNKIVVLHFRYMPLY